MAWNLLIQSVNEWEQSTFLNQSISFSSFLPLNYYSYYEYHFHFSLSCIGEGNGNPLQCSRLENPKDGGAWWAAVYGVSRSQTRLKWLSSSSSRDDDGEGANKIYSSSLNDLGLDLDFASSGQLNWKQKHNLHTHTHTHMHIFRSRGLNFLIDEKVSNYCW